MTAYALNLLDLAFTLHALKHGAVEANPLMQSVPIMIAYKVIIVGALCWWLHKRKAETALRICTAVYAAVDVWHIINILGGTLL